jgi:hypothetical protein
MANGYVDLGTFAGFTPYVGAGAGVTRVAWKLYNKRRELCFGRRQCLWRDPRYRQNPDRRRQTGASPTR